MSHNTFILLAAGSSNRMDGQVSDKILAPIAGKPVFAHSLSTFIRSNKFQEGIIVYRDESQRQQLELICKHELQSLQQQNINTNLPIQWTQGGKRRQDSSFLGIHSTSEETTWVCLHDCARPCLSLQSLQHFIKEASTHPAALLVTPMTDTVKQYLQDQTSSSSTAHSPSHSSQTAAHSSTTNPNVSWPQTLSIDSIMQTTRIPAIVASSEQLIRTVPREDLFCAQTPQAFEKSIILNALQHAFENNITLTDDASALEMLQQPVHMVVHTTPNPKLTYPQDFIIAEALLKSSTN